MIITTKDFDELMLYWPEILEAALMKSKTKMQLSRDLRVRYQTIFGWYRGSCPNFRYLIALAEYTGFDPRAPHGQRFDESIGINEAKRIAW